MTSATSATRSVARSGAADFARDVVRSRASTPSGPSARYPEAIAILVASVGLFVQVVGYAAGWQGNDTLPVPLWYIGFVAIVAPFAWLLLAPSRTGRQRLVASLAFTILMYGSWLLSNPVMATRFDESLHVTTLVTLIDRSSFFQLNTMLPVSPHFPGLELATAGLHWTTGLPLMVCQILVVLTARITFVLALFLLCSRIGGSTRVGATAVLLYAGSAQFYFFNAQYSYQTVAIAMSMAAFYLLIRAFDDEEERPWTLLLAVQACLAALAITHHLTSWLVLGSLWALVLLFSRTKEPRRFRLTLITAELATIVVAAWTAVIAPLLIDYLRPIFDSATNELVAVMNGGSSREVGVASDGTATPTWELMVMAGSILLWMALLAPSVWGAWRKKTIGVTRARYLPLAIAAIYPALQLARFSASAGEVADRASTFVTMAMALVVGAWVAPRIPQFGRLVVPGVLLLVLGGTIIGSGPDWQRTTGPFLAGAEQRSVDSTSVAVGQWAGTYLPAGSTVAADSTFSRLLPNFADVVTVTQPAGFDSMTPLFLSRSLNRQSLELILRNEVDFIVVDTRLVGQRVKSGSYFEGGVGYGEEAATVLPEQVEKFEGVPGFVLVLDGPVKVYDVRALREVPRPFADNQPPGLPGTWTPWQVAFTFLLLGIGVALRGRLLDPRRFEAEDYWRIAVLLPIAMLVGAVGVVTGYSAAAGAIAAAGLLFLLVRNSHQPPRLAVAPPTAVAWTWGTLIVFVCAASAALAILAVWQGLFDIPPFPPPVRGGAGGGA